MILSADEKATIGDIVVERCEAQARRWKACGGDAFGAVFIKVYDNLLSIDHLKKPLEHLVRRTTDLDAQRFFHEEKNVVRSCVPPAAFEDFAADRDSSVLDSLVKAEDHQRLRKALSELPSDQREALLVRDRLQVLYTEEEELPTSIRGLARRRGCSPQHLCNLANRAERRLRKRLL